MPLEESLRFDFRKRALDKTMKRLAEVNAILNLDPVCYEMDEESVDRLGAAQLPLFDPEEQER